MDATHKEELYLRRVLHWPMPISALFEQSFFGVVSIAQSVEVTDSAMLGGVAEVVGWNPSWAIKIFFSIFRHS